MNSASKGTEYSVAMGGDCDHDNRIDTDETFGDDEIFYGSIPVYLKDVAGDATAYDESAYAYEEPYDGATPRTLDRKDPIPHPDGGPPVVVPCIPGLDVIGVTPSTEKISDNANDGCVDWPQQLRRPLVKVDQRVPGAPKAVASGIRSALTKVDGQWYRLKGCGNHNDGFICREATQSIVQGDQPVNTRQIRGSAFVHTAIRENHITTQLAKSLEVEGVLGTNVAMGHYVYGGEEQLPLGSSNPNFQTSCIVQQTRGDRRLGTHVLAGMSLLLESFIDTSQVDEDAIRSTFPDVRKEPWSDLGPLGVICIDEADPLQLETTASLFGRLQLSTAAQLLTRPVMGQERRQAWDHLLQLMHSHSPNGPAPTDEKVRQMVDHVLESRFVRADSALCMATRGGCVSEGILGSWIANAYEGDVNVGDELWRVLCSWRDLGTAPDPTEHAVCPTVEAHMLVRPNESLLAGAEQSPDPSVVPDQFYRCEDGTEQVKSADRRWHKPWHDTCTELNERLTRIGRTRSVLQYVFSRLGFECGRFARLLHFNCQVSWGTYQDAICHPSQWHCNAHCNNMVVLAPGNDANSYLSYLDLDMAFGSHEFVDIDPKSTTFGHVGQAEDDFVNHRLKFENVNFMEVLAGNDSTSGVPKIGQDVVSQFAIKTQLIREYLYDVMMHGYMHAYSNGDKGYLCESFHPELHQAGLCFIKLSIIKQADYIA